MQGYRAIIEALPEGLSPIPSKAVWRTSEMEAGQDGAMLIEASGVQGIFRIETAEVELFEVSWLVSANGGKPFVDEAYFPFTLPRKLPPITEVQIAAIFLQFQETGTVIRKDKIRVIEISRRLP